MNPPDELNFSDDQLLRIEAASQLTTLSKSCINLWVAQGKFPQPLSLSKTVKVWRMGQIRSWMNDLFESQAGDTHDSRSLNDSREGK